jgi:Ca2+/Na+ antiporter
MLLTVIVQLPQLVYGMGVDALQYLRLTALLDGNELVLMLVDGGMIWAILLMLVFLALCAVFACIHIRKNKEEA